MSCAGTVPYGAPFTQAMAQHYMLHAGRQAVAHLGCMQQEAVKGLLVMWGCHHYQSVQPAAEKCQGMLSGFCPR